MPETSATPPAAPAPVDQAKRTIAISAAAMGHDLMAVLLDELRSMPDMWSRLNEQLQQKSIDRIKAKVQEVVLQAQHMLASSNWQAVRAKLEYVNRKGGIKAGLTVRADELCRHALFDAAEKQVLLVIADPSQWLQRMDEIKATGNQADLFNRDDVNYDPTKDQAKYRRGDDPLAPSGKTWADLKKEFATPPPADAKPADPDAKPADADAKPAADDPPPPPVVPPGDDKAVSEHRVSLEMLRARLEKNGVEVSLGTLQSRTDADILAATLWLDATEKLGKKATRDSRPAWFPTVGGSK